MWLVEEIKSQIDIADVKRLIRAYEQELGIDLCFQNFAEEMRQFPAAYKLVLGARHEATIVGCVCLKQLQPSVCEMKRLFVDPQMRARGIAKALSLRLIEAARARGYKEMKLDTLARLKPAVALYQGLGFKETAPYTANPEPDVLFMSLML